MGGSGSGAGAECEVRLTEGLGPVATCLAHRAVARAADLTPSTVNALIRGLLIPDAATISALETTLNTNLWPHLGASANTHEAAIGGTKTRPTTNEE